MTGPAAAWHCESCGEEWAPLQTHGEEEEEEEACVRVCVDANLNSA